MTLPWLLHFSLKLLEILYITKRFCKVIPEADCSLPLTGSQVSFSDITRVRIDHFLKPVTDKGMGKSFNEC